VGPRPNEGWKPEVLARDDGTLETLVLVLVD